MFAYNMHAYEHKLTYHQTYTNSFPKFRNVPNTPCFTETRKCEMMFYLLKLVLDRAHDLQSKCFSEDQVNMMIKL